MRTSYWYDIPKESVTNEVLCNHLNKIDQPSIELELDLKFSTYTRITCKVKTETDKYCAVVKESEKLIKHNKTT